MLRLTSNAVYYTLNRLFAIAGKDLEWNHVNYVSDGKHQEVFVRFENGYDIIFRMLSEDETNRLLNKELLLGKIPSYDSAIEVPVAFSDQSKGFADFENNQLVINADIITLSFILLSRYEETLTRERDRYNRFQYRMSLAYKYDFIDIPLVDEYAMLLRVLLQKYIPGLKINKRQGSIIPTHDIDFLLRFGSLYKNIKTIIGGDLIARKSLSMAYDSLGQCIASRKEAAIDPLIQAIRKLIQVSSDFNLKSVFYFKGLTDGANDCTYDIFSPEAKYCIDLVRERGMEAGMHAGLDSYNNVTVLLKEKMALESVMGSEVKKIRQHFLRFDINRTPEIWGDSGVLNDSTLGYAEREGFRCGTAHPYPLYDLSSDCESSVMETPLIVMEGTLFLYRKLKDEEALESIRKLYSRTRAVEGDFVILWHNHSVFRDYDKKFREVYCKFIQEAAC
jgi:hypothetical protein